MPMIKDVGPLFNVIGEIMIATGVIFLLMLFCACPICCFNKEKLESEEGIVKPIHDESVEMALNK